MATTIRVGKSIILSRQGSHDKSRVSSGGIWRGVDGHINSDPKGSREDGGKIRHTIPKENRPLDLGCDGWMKPTKINSSIELLVITLEG